MSRHLCIPIDNVQFLRCNVHCGFGCCPDHNFQLSLTNRARHIVGTHQAFHSLADRRRHDHIILQVPTIRFAVRTKVFARTVSRNEVTYLLTEVDRWFEQFLEMSCTTSSHFTRNDITLAYSFVDLLSVLFGFFYRHVLGFLEVMLVSEPLWYTLTIAIVIIVNI